MLVHIRQTVFFLFVFCFEFVPAPNAAGLNINWVLYACIGETHLVIVPIDQTVRRSDHNLFGRLVPCHIVVPIVQYLAHHQTNMGDSPAKAQLESKPLIVVHTRSRQVSE